MLIIRLSYQKFLSTRGRLELCGLQVCGGLSSPLGRDAVNLRILSIENQYFVSGANVDWDCPPLAEVPIGGGG